MHALSRDLVVLVLLGAVSIGAARIFRVRNKLELFG